jgi:hypothetical protein
MSDLVDAADQRILQRLALRDWPEAAAARVVSVSVVGNRAEVALLVDGDHGCWMYFRRDDLGWSETVAGNGPVVGWDHPEHIQWRDDGGSPGGAESASTT